uniref:SDR family NAD(P)-dependent oxidoreductase n=1 Tax=Streptomyces sp. NBC_01401 TaxID=2903854 RepID=A0AAU3GPJ8_9ACTN
MTTTLITGAYKSLGLETARRLIAAGHSVIIGARKFAAPVIVNVSSGMGSFGMTHDPDRVESQYALPLYSTSKAAVTMLTAQYARELPDVRINAADPGQTATDFTGGLGRSVAEGAESIVALATIGPDGPTGQFIDRNGTLPW